MSFDVIERDHFDGHKRLTQGQATNGEPILADMFRKFRTAKVVAAGAGDEAVTFDAFDDTDYTVGYMFEDSAGGAALGAAYVKQSTIAVGGFTATVDAAGTYHFILIHD